MRGIILAGGSGTRMFPNTAVVSKQLLSLWDKPCVFYPLSTLMLAGIKDILIISTPRDLPFIESLLKDGSQFGIKLSYKIQDQPNGIAQAFILGEEFIGKEPCCLILGDNVFYGHDIPKQMKEAMQYAHSGTATVFAHHVSDPERFGVVEIDDNGRAKSIEEKPKNPKSSWAVTGLYFYPGSVVDMAKSLKPSSRGELEITDLNKLYLNKYKLRVEKLGRGVTWMDAGTNESLLEASQFVKMVEDRQGLKIGCLEEIALNQNFITDVEFFLMVDRYPQCPYKTYLMNIYKEWNGKDK